MGWLSALADVGSSAVGAGIDYFSAKQQNDMATGQAREAMRFTGAQSAQQMAFQERMSNTAHQREVADLRAAGLNPLLSLNSGASTPGGAMGSGVNAPVVPELGAAVGSARESMRLKADLGLLKEHTRSAKSRADIDHMEAVYARVDPAAYFTAKQGGLNTLFGRAMGSVSNSARSIRGSWWNQSLPNIIRGSGGYISDAEMRKRGRNRVDDKRSFHRLHGRSRFE